VSDLFTVTCSVFPAQPQVACERWSIRVECQYHWL